MILVEIQNLIKRGALFVVNHSGGKDSQAMMVKVRQLVPQDQILVIHAALGDVEWPDVIEHIKQSIGDFPLLVAHALNRQGDRKRFLDMVERRGMWPSPTVRQCTSDLKRGPIEREIRRYVANNPQFKGLVVNCEGMRAAESSNRAKKDPFTFSKRNSKAGREWYDWLPIHDLSTEEVFAVIDEAGQRPHWAYAAGMSRLSCCFCIMASQKDLTIAAQLNPSLYRRYVAMERKLGHTLIMPRKGEEPRTLDKITGIPVKEKKPRALVGQYDLPFSRK